MAHNFNDVKFSAEISKRMLKSSFSVGVFLKLAENFTVKYMSPDGQEVESSYLAVKMVGVEKESLWLGYKVKEVLGGNKVEIDVTDLLWIYIDCTILKKQIRVNKLEEFSIASILKNSDKELPIKIGETAKNIDYHTRCINMLNNTINEIYSKARIHSFLKMLTHFSVYEYDFLKSEYADEDQHEDGKFVLKTRFVPLNIKLDKGKNQTAISIYINSLKDGAKHVGLWLVVPVQENGFLDADKISFVAGLSSKNINVNSTASTSSQIEIKHLPKEVLTTKDDDGDLESWINGIFDKFGISKFVASSNIKDFVDKFEKSKELVSQEIVENIYFSNIDKFENNSIKLTDFQAKEAKLVSKTIKQLQGKTVVVQSAISDDDKSDKEIVDEKSVTQESADLVVEDVEQIKEVKDDKFATNAVAGSSSLNGQVVQENTVSISTAKAESKDLIESIIKESIDEDGYWSFKKVGDSLVFEHTLLHCQISFSIKQMLDISNKVFNEMLQLSIDPYTIVDAFREVGHEFKKYAYKQVRKLITEVPDEVLNNYIDLENYYDLVETEKYDRSIKKG